MFTENRKFGRIIWKWQCTKHFLIKHLTATKLCENNFCKWLWLHKGEQMQQQRFRINYLVIEKKTSQGVTRAVQEHWGNLSFPRSTVMAHKKPHTSRKQRCYFPYLGHSRRDADIKTKLCCIPEDKHSTPGNQEWLCFFETQSLLEYFAATTDFCLISFKLVISFQ